MSFYRHPSLVFWLYLLPALGGILCVHNFLAYKLRRWPADWLENAMMIEMCVFWSLLLALMTYLGIDSAVFAFAMVLFGFPLRYVAERLNPRIRGGGGWRI